MGSIDKQVEKSFYIIFIIFAMAVCFFGFVAHNKSFYIISGLSAIYVFCIFKTISREFKATHAQMIHTGMFLMFIGCLVVHLNFVPAGAVVMTIGFSILMMEPVFFILGCEVIAQHNLDNALELQMV